MTTAAPEVDLRFPVGKFRWDPAEATAEGRREWTRRIAALPARFRAAVESLTDAQLDTPYRPGGWTVRQLAHHVPDSHMNAYIRMKLALTEEAPAVKTYDEAAWAELPDTPHTPVAVSLTLLEALHTRWVALLEGITDEQWSRPIVHPEHGALSLEQVLALYAWHSDHHLAHVERLRERMGW